MKYQRSSKGTLQLLNSSQLRKPLTAAGARVANKVRRNINRDTGRTVASVHIRQRQHAGIKGDRIGLSIIVRGAGVPLQFGNKRTKATRPLTRALIE